MHSVSSMSTILAGHDGYTKALNVSKAFFFFNATLISQLLQCWLLEQDARMHDKICQLERRCSAIFADTKGVAPYISNDLRRCERVSNASRTSKTAATLSRLHRSLM